MSNSTSHSTRVPSRGPARGRRHTPPVAVVVALLLAAAVAAASCAGDDDGAASTTTQPTTAPATTPAPTTTEPAPSVPLVFSPEGNNLWVYADTPGYPSQEVDTNAADDPARGRDINAQVCFVPDGSGRFIAGEDTNQPHPRAGFGVFQLEGDRVGEFSVEQVGKLTPTYQSHPDNFGCGFLSNGALVTTDIGNTVTGPGDGQLIVWFPPFSGGALDATAPNAGFDRVAYCKVDTGIATPGGIYVDADDNVYVGSARPPTAGVLRYSGDWPTGADGAGGCGRTDATGKPLVDSGAVDREVFIPAGPHRLASPHSVAPAPDGGLYVSSVINGVIDEFDADGDFVRTILEPPAGEELGAEPFSTGTPLGLATGPDGSLFYADIGIVADPVDGFGPGERTGSLRVIRFLDGEPQPPDTIADHLQFPDGLGVVAPGGGTDVSSVV